MLILAPVYVYVYVYVFLLEAVCCCEQGTCANPLWNMLLVRELIHLGTCANLCLEQAHRHMWYDAGGASSCQALAFQHLRVKKPYCIQRAWVGEAYFHVLGASTKKFIFTKPRPRAILSKEPAPTRFGTCSWYVS